MSQAGPAIASILPLGLPAGRVERVVRLWTESLALTGIGVFVALGWGTAQAGALSIFLVAASLVPRFRQVVGEGTKSVASNPDQVSGSVLYAGFALTAMFMGVSMAYGAVALIQGTADLTTLFGGALEFGEFTSVLAPGVLAPGARASALHDLLVHQYGMILSFFGLAFVYRSYAATLALAYGACIWGIVGADAVGTLVHQSSVGVGITALLVGVIPTALLHCAALIGATVSAVAISRALFSFPVRDPRMLHSLRLGLAIFALSGLFGLAATAFEWYVASAFFA